MWILYHCVWETRRTWSDGRKIHNKTGGLELESRKEDHDLSYTCDAAKETAKQLLKHVSSKAANYNLGEDCGSFGGINSTCFFNNGDHLLLDREGDPRSPAYIELYHQYISIFEDLSTSLCTHMSTSSECNANIIAILPNSTRVTKGPSESSQEVMQIRHSLLDIFASTRLRRGTRKRRPHVNDSQLDPFLQIRVGIEVILLGVATPKEQKTLGNFSTCFLLRRALLEEPSHRGQTRASTEHHEGNGGIIWRMERSVGRANCQLNFVTWYETGQIGGSNTEERLAATRDSRSDNDADSKSDTLRVGEWGRRD